MKYVIEFDYRSDEGPRLVGPFDTPDDATSWIEKQRFYASDCHVAPLAEPE